MKSRLFFAFSVCSSFHFQSLLELAAAGDDLVNGALAQGVIQNSRESIVNYLKQARFHLTSEREFEIYLKSKANIVQIGFSQNCGFNILHLCANYLTFTPVEV